MTEVCCGGKETSQKSGQPVLSLSEHWGPKMLLPCGCSANRRCQKKMAWVSHATTTHLCFRHCLLSSLKCSLSPSAGNYSGSLSHGLQQHNYIIHSRIRLSRVQVGEPEKIDKTTWWQGNTVLVQLTPCNSTSLHSHWARCLRKSWLHSSVNLT